MRKKNSKNQACKIFPHRKYFTLIELLVACQPKPWRRPIQAKFTLIELLVVIAIIAILASILLPALNYAKGTAKKIVCASNEKNLFTAITLYQDESNEFYPYAGWNFGGISKIWTWDDAISGYDGRKPRNMDTDGVKYRIGTETNIDDAAFYRCPSEERFVTETSTQLLRSYAMNSGGRGFGWGDSGGSSNDHLRGISRALHLKGTNLRMVPDPAGTFLLVEIRKENRSNVMSGNNWGGSSSADNPSEQQNGLLVLPWHGQGKSWNYLFCDGHVDNLTPQQSAGTGNLTTPNGGWTRTPND